MYRWLVGNNILPVAGIETVVGGVGFGGGGKLREPACGRGAATGNQQPGRVRVIFSVDGQLGQGDALCSRVMHKHYLEFVL